MTTLVRRSHDFRHALSIEDVECCLLEWSAAKDAESETELNLAGLRNVEPGAGIRLANAMRRWATGRLVIVLASGLDLNGSDWFRLFSRSGIGWAIATHAKEVKSGEHDITADVRTYYESISSTHANSCLMYRNLESGALAPSQDRFMAVLFVAMREHLARAEEWIEIEDRRALARLAYEAIVNVVDHAFASPWAEEGEQLSYLSLRWYQTISTASDARGGLHSFRRSHRRSLGLGEDISGWLEIVVADDGVGIAARQRQIPEKSIYHGPISEEDAALREALSTNSTVKLRARDAQLRGEPGYGTTIMVECLRRVGAYAALRKGRRLVEFDPWRQQEFELNPVEFGWMPGTAVQVLLPVHDRQLRLHA